MRNEEEIETKIGDYPVKLRLANPKQTVKVDKVNAMRMALTYIEIRRLKVSPQEATKIADEFLEWLRKEEVSASET